MTSLTSLADGTFVALLEAVPDAMVCVATDGRVALVNAQAERLFGYERAELIGQPVENLVSDADRAVHPGHWAGYLADPQHRPMGAGLPLAGRRRDASTFPAEISSSAIDTDEGILVAVAIRDVTAELRIKDLERSNRGLESFTYTVAHDLRAPLRALSGYSGLLLEEYGEVLGEEGRGYAERVVAVSEQMGRLIDYLLEYSRVSRAELRLQSVDLGGEAARIAEDLQRQEPLRHVCFTIAKPVQVLADGRLIRTVLQNLLDNAWKFTSGRDDASIEFGTAPSGDAAVCCYVRDNGVGFDSAYADKLFQPFQRLHAADDFAGAGTGLASVRQIVERHGGRVWAEGGVGAGATFYFTLDEKESA
ncbi:MAG TPA: ATP-binding protein [Streptosporangiaceae bacterium]|nr:ATP-binding protein [Streptosporangiaceae bacterium]